MVLSLVLSNTACTTLRPVEIASGDIQDRILAGELIKMGNRVSIVTKDGKVHQIKVTEVRDGFIKGRTDDLNNWSKDVAIPVAEVLAMSTREISVVKTGGFTVLSLVTTLGLLVCAFILAHAL